MKIHIIDGNYVWLMESDFCDNCGAFLGLDDCSGLCPTCFDLYIAETNEDDWYDGWDSDWDIPIEEVGQP